jgi:hypothetical protein
MASLYEALASFVIRVQEPPKPAEKNWQYMTIFILGKFLIAL